MSQQGKKSFRLDKPVRPLGGGFLRGKGKGYLKDEVGKVGAGASSTVLSNCVDMIKARASMPALPHFMDVIYQTQLSFDGPILNQDVQKLFGAQSFPLDVDRDAEGPSYIQSNLYHGETITHFMVFALGIKFETGPVSLVARGNAATNLAAAAQQFASPDAYTLSDKKNGSWANAAGTPIDLTANGDMFPAVLRVGSAWQALMFYHLARAKNFTWSVSNNVTIIDNILRSMAFTPDLAQNGSASSSNYDIDTLVKECNDYYGGAPFNASRMFLKWNRLRLGSLGTNIPTGATAPIGNFSASREEEALGVTYGGAAMGSELIRDLRSNSEFVKLPCPWIIKGGQPTGIQLRTVDSAQDAHFQNALSITGNASAAVGASSSGNLIPPYYVDQANITAGYDTGMFERCMDSASATFLQQMDSERYVFKLGPFKVTTQLLGVELNDEEYDMLTGDGDVRAFLQRECGMGFSHYAPRT